MCVEPIKVYLLLYKLYKAYVLKLTTTTLIVSLLIGCVTVAAVAQLPPGFQIEAVVSDAAVPVSLAPVPDGRIFYAELLTGSIRVVEDGLLEPQPFVTIHVATSFDVAGARGLGLLGVTADPDFSSNHFLYALYTPTPDEIVISRFREVDGLGTDEVEILRQPGNGKHNGGRLVFLPDKTLLVTRGDMGFRDLAQDDTVVHGKIIRINVDGSIPNDNPIIDSPIFALGVRNSFGIAVHPLTGRPYFSENGPREDEINILQSGGNYGWPICIGKCDPPIEELIDPLVSFVPSICPTGMDFYSGQVFPHQYRNDLFMTDCNTGRIQRIKLVPPAYDHVGVLQDFVGEGSAGTLDVKMGADGNLYYTTFDTVLRIIPPVDDTTAEFHGIVMYSDSTGEDTAIVGANVVLKQRSENVTIFKHRTLTDETGHYRFTGLSEGNYRVVVKKSGFEKEKLSVVIDRATSNVEDIALTKKPS